MNLHLATVGYSVMYGHYPCVDYLEDIMYSSWISYNKLLFLRDLWK